MHPAAEERFTVLFVCTGNICRSPTAERMLGARLRARLGPAMPFEIASAGTGALVGEPIFPDAARLLMNGGIDVSGFVARDLARPMAESADLILAMTREHRAATARLAPRTLPKLFTLREFARTVAQHRDAWPTSADSLSRARALVVLAQQRRGLAGPVDPVLDDVPDPYRRAPHVYEQAWALISESIDVIIDGIAE